MFSRHSYSFFGSVNRLDSDSSCSHGCTKERISWISDDGESSEGNANSLPCSPASINTTGAKITSGIQSPRTLEKSGYLHKQGGVQGNKGWRKRWVIFNGRDLRYYSNEKTQVSKRIVPLSSMREVDQDIKETEKNQFKFVLKTKNRNFLFATETLEENILWCSTLKQAILLFKPTPEDTLEGGIMNNPDKSGHVKFEGFGRFYVVVKNSILCYYRRFEDFQIGSPINELDMKLASVKELSKTKLQLYTNYFQVCLIFENALETQQWKETLKNATEIGLCTQHGFSESPAAKVWENPSNKNCADCDAQDPNWAALDFGILICKKCSGIHREFNLVKSLLLDYKIWTPSLIEMMQQIGNENANNFWEFGMNPALKIDSNATDIERKDFIENKYKKKLFINSHHLHNQPNMLNEALLEAVKTDDILKTMKILFSGADLNYTSPERPTETAFQLAKKSSQRLQMEFLLHNQADKMVHLPGGDNCDELVATMRNAVHYQGYLHKTGVNMKASDFLRRWCLLEHCCLSYYADKKHTVAKGNIENTMMLVIQATVMDKYPYSFELSTTQHNNRIYQFAAESLPEQTSWMQALAKIFCPPHIMSAVTEFDLAGYFYFKWHGMEWSRIWLRIYCKELRIFTKDKEGEKYDLRKTINVNVINSEQCPHTIQSGYPFIAGFPERSLYFQADLQHDTERLEKAIRAATTKCQNRLEDQQLTSDDVPVIVDKCIKFIMTNGLSEDGIYRRNGIQSRVTALLETFEKDAQDVHLLLKNFTLHDVTSALRKFFRNLEDPLLTRKSYEDWLNAASKEDTQIKLKLYKYLVDSLPSINRNTLKKMVIHLWSISQHQHENKMGIDQLAIVFGPTLMSAESTQNGQYVYYKTNAEISVIREIIFYHEYLFEVKPEKEIEDKIQKALRDLEIRKSMHQTNEDLSSLNLHIHVGVYNSEPIMINGSFQMSAEDLLKSVKQKIFLKDVNWLLFEVVCKGMLERPVHNFEVIGDVIGQWQNWDDADARTAVLLVRQEHLCTQLRDHYDPARSLMAELEFSDKKGIKKYLFEFSQARLSYYKDTKGTNLVSSWRVEDLIIYKGVEAGRNSKDRTGFTFVVKNVKTKRTKDAPYFGHALYFPTEGMMLCWYAGMMFTKFPSIF
ncbi:unnamed protein product [Acanthosepion pharaonis]|uniref:Uncharacterized protein n=1 Tax=Acanthosepion pharaonis TaxID=158019 RepID=A0A812BB19_ACAPH|nr:unnamed protein product [Sepia pharaonis]